MTDDGERIAKVEVRVENLEHVQEKHASTLEKLRSERMKLLISVVLLLAGVLFGIFKDALF